MKRLCFDTESDHYRHPLAGIGDVELHREEMRESKSKIRFDCGVVYDEENDKYLEFRNDQAAELVGFLATADELVSQNGKRCDLPVLERVCGEDRVAPLWQIKHHDPNRDFWIPAARRFGEALHTGRPPAGD
jgi:hypothetical protein